MEQSTDLARLASCGRRAGHPEDRYPARKGGDRQFCGMADAQVSSKNRPSGVGVKNYDWYLNVQLVPFLAAGSDAHGARVGAGPRVFALEEQRNAAPRRRRRSRAKPNMRAGSVQASRVHGLPPRPRHLTVRDDMDPRCGLEPAASTRVLVSSSPRWTIAIPVMRSLPLVRSRQMANDWPERHPAGSAALQHLRHAPEGHATAEEMMLQAGMFDAPRSRELIYSRRAARRGRWRPEDAREPGDARAGGAVCIGEHAAWMAATRGNTSAGTTSLSGSPRVRHELRRRQDPVELLTERRRQLGQGFSINDSWTSSTARG